MTEKFLTTDELRIHLRLECDTLNLLRKCEPKWNKEARTRGVKTIRATQERIALLEAELQMASQKSRKSA